jgi:acyl-CoA thioester hydrolase
VSSWITRIGTKSFTMRQELVQDGQVAIRLDGVLVVFDLRTDTSRALTDEERAFWSCYLDG